MRARCKGAAAPAELHMLHILTRFHMSSKDLEESESRCTTPIVSTGRTMASCTREHESSSRGLRDRNRAHAGNKPWFLGTAAYRLHWRLQVRRCYARLCETALSTGKN